MANPLESLMPNSLGNLLANTGVEELVQNRGLGVKEASQTNLQAMSQRSEKSNPEAIKNKLRVAKAREFGLTKETIGF